MSKYKLSFKSITEILKYIEEQEIQFIDLSFTDLNGRWHSTAQHHSSFTKQSMDKGISFHSSSISGLKAGNITNLLLKPDIKQVTYDPFATQKTIKIFCDIYSKFKNSPDNFDSRSIAKAAENHLKKSGFADTAYFGTQTEFFIFNDKKSLDQNDILSQNYSDNLSDLRSEMLSVIETMGVAVTGHANKANFGQCEIGIKHSNLLQAADNLQIYKHAIKNVAKSYGKSATFMPKPISSNNGSGMCLNQSLWKSSKPIFAGKSYANLSENALYYIGGILKHSRALNAFTNPTINSYKRLALENNAPMLIGYSETNNSSTCNIPFSTTPKTSRIITCFPDPLANPYLAFSAMLMAGLDGIENKIHPGEAIDKIRENQNILQLCSSLSEAVTALESNHDFLLKGDVFTPEIIKAFIELKTEEIKHYKSITHIAEIDMYYSG